MNSLTKEILVAGKKYQEEKQIPFLSFDGYRRYLKDGNRLLFEKEYFARRRQLAVVALDYYLEPDEKKLPWLEEVIWQVLQEYTWSLPAHLPIENETYASDASYTLDLFAAETSETLSEIYHYLRKDLHPFLVSELKENIQKRIFEPLEKKTWPFETMTNNWSAVVGGSIGLSALYLLEKGSLQQKQILKRLDKAMKSYLNGFYEDGACLEGVGYWVYGFGYYLYYAEALKEVYGVKDYLENPKVKKIAAFPFHTELGLEKYVPFSDAGDVALPSGLVSYCKQEFKVEIPTVKDYSPLDFDHCYRFAHLIRNVNWTKSNDFSQSLKKDFMCYPDAQWVLAKDPKIGYVFATKGGTNNESHNHNDLGHFVYGTPNQLFLTDLGAGEYTKDYFVDEKRYNYLAPHSKSHSVPVINGYYQQPGDFKSQLISYEDTKENLKVTFDLKEAYPKESDLKHFIRSFTLDKNSGELDIQDSFEFFTAQNEIEERFVTENLPKIKNNQEVYLENEDEGIKIAFEAEKIHFTEEKYKKHQGEKGVAYFLSVKEKGKEKITNNIKISLFLLKK